MNLILPMAGAGARFIAAGYTAPKPLIGVQGRPMLAWALDPIPRDWRIYLVSRPQTPPQGAYEAFLALRLDYDLHWINLAGITEGAACTVLAAAVGLPPDEPVAVMNSDQTFRPTQPLGTLRDQADLAGWDGAIYTFVPADAGDTRWSYVATDERNIVLEVAEKRPIGPQATVGFYWWRRARDLVWSIAQMIAVNDRTNHEFYLAPSYQHLIRVGARIAAVPVPWFRGLGTPEDVGAFEAEKP